MRRFLALLAVATLAGACSNNSADPGVLAGAWRSRVVPDLAPIEFRHGETASGGLVEPVEYTVLSADAEKVLMRVKTLDGPMKGTVTEVLVLPRARALRIGSLHYDKVK